MAFDGNARPRGGGGGGGCRPCDDARPSRKYDGPGSLAEFGVNPGEYGVSLTRGNQVAATQGPAATTSVAATTTTNALDLAPQQDFRWDRYVMAATVADDLTLAALSLRGDPLTFNETCLDLYRADSKWNPLIGRRVNASDVLNRAFRNYNAAANVVLDSTITGPVRDRGIQDLPLRPKIDTCGKFIPGSERQFVAIGPIENAQTIAAAATTTWTFRTPDETILSRLVCNVPSDLCVVSAFTVDTKPLQIGQTPLSAFGRNSRLNPKLLLRVKQTNLISISVINLSGATVRLCPTFVTA